MKKTIALISLFTLLNASFVLGQSGMTLAQAEAKKDSLEKELVPVKAEEERLHDAGQRRPTALLLKAKDIRAALSKINKEIKRKALIKDKESPKKEGPKNTPSVQLNVDSLSNVIIAYQIKLEELKKEQVENSKKLIDINDKIAKYKKKHPGKRLSPKLAKLQMKYLKIATALIIRISNYFNGIVIFKRQIQEAANTGTER